jgi:hypothetical protein
VKVRIAVAALLLVVAVALPLLAVSSRGAPWGFRGHQAVLLEAAGTVEVSLSEERQARERRDSGAVSASPGLFLESGDEVRAGRYAEARLRLPAGEVIARDGARLVLGEGARAGKHHLSVAHGLVEVSVPSSDKPFEVKIDGLDAMLVLRAGAEGGRMRVLVDNQGARAWVGAGSVEGRTSGGDATADSGKVVAIGSDRKPRVEAAPSSLEPSATCIARRLVVSAPDGTQVFAGGGLHYPAGGRVELDVPARSTVPFFARDVVGNVAHVDVPCLEKPEEQKPRPNRPAPGPR